MQAMACMMRRGIEEEVPMPQLTKDPLLLVQTRPLSPSEFNLSNFTFNRLNRKKCSDPLKWDLKKV